jgi:predicted nucleic acid-binding protein
LIYVLDACALIALVKKEKGYEKIKSLLDEASTGQSTIYMHTINLIEVYYHFYRSSGKEKSGTILEQIYKMPVNFVDFIDPTIFSETSRLKAAYAIPLGDSIGLATAFKTEGVFVTADHSDFEEIEKTEAFSFFWFR